MFRLKESFIAPSSCEGPFKGSVVGTLKRQLGENGMPELSSLGVGSDLLVLNQMVRGGSPAETTKKLLLGESPINVANTILLVFATRNSRGGKGEKKLSYDMFIEVLKSYPQTANSLATLFPHFGYWKDLLLLMELVSSRDDIPKSRKDTFNETCMVLMCNQLRKDMEAAAKTKAEKEDAMTDEDDTKPAHSISLLAKWLPRENSHFDKKLGFVKMFAKKLFPDMGNETGAWESKAKAEYRRTVAKLTETFKLPEVLLSAEREEEINFHLIASQATLRLRKVFLNQGKDRPENPKRARLAERFLEHTIKNGLKGGQLMPHEIVQKVMKSSKMSKGEELVLDAQWKSMRESVLLNIQNGTDIDIDPTRMVPLSDVSGSMSGTPMEVAIALGILISEITHEAFKNMVMTFESQPRWHMLDSSQTIVEKVRSLQRAPWGGSTNFEAAYDLILNVAKQNHLKREDMPTLIVFSDMQFDMAAGHGYSTGKTATMHKVITGKVQSVGRLLGWDDPSPNPIVYWNLRNTGGHPVGKDTEGAVLLAGFSPSLLKVVMNGTILKETEVEVVQADGTTKTEKVKVTPEEILAEILADDSYNLVREIIDKSEEGQLRHVEAVKVEEEGDDDFDMVDSPP